MNQTPEHCDCTLRVRYAETDQMGVAYYSNYFVWFEVGRAEFCRRRGFSYDQLEKTTHSYLIVAEAYCRYLSPLRYDQEFVVRTRLQELRRRSLTFGYQLLRSDLRATLAEGETKHVVVDFNGRPKTFPQEFLRFLR